MTPLTAEEKREIVRRFRELHAAIIHSRPDVDEKFNVFRAAYKGPLFPYIADFEKAPSKTHWVAQLGVFLLGEIDEPMFWSVPRRTEI